MPQSPQLAVDLPPLPPPSLDAAPGPLTREEFERLVADYDEQRTRKPYHGHGMEALPEGTTDVVMDHLQRLVRLPEARDDGSLPELRGISFLFTQGPVQKALRRLVSAPDLSLVHVVRLLVLLGQFPLARDEGHRMGPVVDPLLQSWRASRAELVGLREVAAVMQALGLDDRLLGIEMLDRWTRVLPPLFAWEDEAVWPYFAERTDLLERALSGEAWEGSAHYVDMKPFLRKNALEILGRFPRVPEILESAVWRAALGSARAERALVAKCLERLPDRALRIAAALGDGRQEVRMAAAEWVRHFRLVRLVPEMRRALEREKSDAVRAEFMRSLEALGVPADEFLDGAGLLDEARKGMARGIPEALSWVGLDALPALAWEDNGAPVDDVLLRWLIVQAWKLKTPEPSPHLRACCRLMGRSGREALGRRLLEAWMAQDTIPRYNYDEALAETERISSQFRTSIYQDIFPDRTPEQIFQLHLNALLAECRGSAIAEKGVLAVAGACCGPDVAPLVQKFLDQWHGNRTAQCRALVAMLSWIDHPMAVQTLYGVASRFRTRTIQAEAHRCLRALADRNGWTVEELADRTLPTAGFERDEAGGPPRLVLDYGERKFVATLDAEFRIVIAGPDGQVVSALPEPRRSDDANLAREAKERLSRARKELKSILGAQKERLLESLCTQRPWRYEDWASYVQAHPIVGCYARSLVWVAERATGEKVTFRPLDDGSLTSVDDDEVRLDAADLVRLAHACTVSAAEAVAWNEHFRDYEVAALLPQFERPPFHLHPERRGDPQADEFEGHMVSTFRLRARATKLGYARGSAQDGGWFTGYHRVFPGLGLEAVVRFSGNSLPETERAVALEALYFTRFVSEGGGRAPEPVRVPLGEVPPVLLSECWNDVQGIASEGSGYDPDWVARLH